MKLNRFGSVRGYFQKVLPRPVDYVIVLFIVIAALVLSVGRSLFPAGSILAIVCTVFATLAVLALLLMFIVPFFHRRYRPQPTYENSRY